MDKVVIMKCRLKVITYLFQLGRIFHEVPIYGIIFTIAKKVNTNFKSIKMVDRKRTIS
jgi:hypothetical protein